MTRIQVQAGQTLLESYVKTPPAGLCELIWNAFDADASSVTVTIETNDLGGLDQIVVEDDGVGMSEISASSGFEKVGDSWKVMPGTLSVGKRPVHGRYGRGRYAAFSLGSSLQWSSVAEGVGGKLECITVSGQRGDLQHFDVNPTSAPERLSTGTRVIIGQISPEAVASFDHLSDISNRLLTEFALHLDRFKDFKITFLDEVIDPGRVIDHREDIALELPEGVDGAATLTVIEWKLDGVDRQMYLCTAEGSVIDEIPPAIQAPGLEFTAYLRWDGFAPGHPLALEGDTETPTGKVIQAARVALKDHLSASARKREAETVNRWRSEGVYPYKEEPKTPVEKATRDAFDVIAMATSRTVDEAKSRGIKALSLSLLKEAFEHDPESIFPILKEVTHLPASRITELKEILQHTSLSQLIQVGREVGNRVHFLDGLNEILFSRAIKRRMLERRQLHRILAHETWIFGEEWSLTGDDERLTEVLKKFLAKLGKDVELASTEPVLREDGSDAIPDLVLGRRLKTGANHFAHLVVELKRPSHKLDDDDVSQLRSYASAITNDERFAQPNVSWDFLLVGNETTRSVDEAREQENLPFGVVQASKKYRIVVKQWAEIISDADHRMKFVQEALQYESTRDSGLQYLREKYAEYLPEVALADTEGVAPEAPAADDESATDV